MSTEKKIHVKVVSIEGHTDLDLSPVEAVSTIRSKCTDEAKWLFVDGVHIGDLSTLGIDALTNAQDITMTNQLAGGR